MTLVLAGSAVIVAVMWAFLTFKPVPGAPTGALANVIASVLVVVFGFLFVTVSSRIAGLIGTSSNPISGMAIATLMATCALFLVAGWTGGRYGALALTIGGVVCIAAANAGDTSQDTEDGLPGGGHAFAAAIALIIGVMVSVFAIGGTLMLMNFGLSEFRPVQIDVDAANPPGAQVETQKLRSPGQDIHPGQRAWLASMPDGKYLFTTRKRGRSKCSGCRASAATRPPRRRRG